MNWALLIAALIQVESGGDTNAIGDGGNAVGCLQIWEGVVQDVNRIKGTNFTHDEMFDEGTARYVCYVYLRHYGKAYTKRTGEEPTMETYARIWNGGYHGLFRNKQATDSYWEKVRKELY
jgi:hypothetical protein